jgi:predicted permease
MYGNPTFWTAPLAAATLGAEAAVFVIAFDMLTQARIAVGVKYLRRHAPKTQSARTALADYAPSLGAVTGLAVGIVLPAPDVVDTLVAGLGVVMAGFGFLLLGVSWPRRWIGRPQIAMTLRALSLHLTIVPSLLGLATLAGVELPGAVWLLAFGPIPTSVVSFAQVYGYSPKTAATGLAISITCAIVLLPLSLTLAG